MTVSNANGTATLASAFTYTAPAAPTLASLSPTNGSAAGGVNVTLRGTGFSQGGATTVQFDGTRATNVTVVGDTAVTCVTPAGTIGTVDVTLTNSRGTVTLPAAFTYRP